MTDGKWCHSLPPIIGLFCRADLGQAGSKTPAIATYTTMTRFRRELTAEPEATCDRINCTETIDGEDGLHRSADNVEQPLNSPLDTLSRFVGSGFDFGAECPDAGECEAGLLDGPR